MKPLELDFADRAHRWKRAGWPILTVGLLFLAFECAYVFGVQRPTGRQLETQLAGELALQPVAPTREQSVEKQALRDAARRADAALRLPWPQLFAFLDQSSGPDLALLSVEPDALKGVVVLSAEARNYRALVKFFEAMQTSSLFSDVNLQSHAINETVAEQPIRFRMRARWVTVP